MTSINCMPCTSQLCNRPMYCFSTFSHYIYEQPDSNLKNISYWIYCFNLRKQNIFISKLIFYIAIKSTAVLSIHPRLSKGVLAHVRWLFWTIFCLLNVLRYMSAIQTLRRERGGVLQICSGKDNISASGVHYNRVNHKSSTRLTKNLQQFSTTKWHNI